MPGFNVPNATDLVAGTIRSLDQAEPDSLDFQVAGNRRNGVVSGAEVSSVSSASSNPTPAYLNVTLSACEVVINGVYGSITSGLTVVVPSAPAGADTRFDVICAYNNSGTFQLDVVTGTSSSSNPVFPAIPSSKIPLYAVYVKSGENATDPAELLIDKRVLMLSSLVRTGTGDPAGTLGGVGDIYLDVSAQTVNTRSGVWVKSDSTTWRRLASYGELTGDVTTVGTAATIANNAVTSAKLNTAVAGNGLSGGGGSALAVNVDGTTIEISSDSLRIKDGGVGPAKLSAGTYAINISGSAGSASYSTYWWAQSHVGSYYLVANWDNTRWHITSNHGAAVRVGYADAAGSAGSASSAGSVPASGITGQAGMWASGNRPGPTRLYRRDADNAYSVQTRYDGSRWILEGYENDTPHAPCRVGYADSAGDASVSAQLRNSGDAFITSGYNVSYANVVYIYNNGARNSSHGYTTSSFNVNLIPEGNNVWTCGAQGARWSAIWAANGTIQTSDIRLKTDVQQSSLGLEFIKKLNPVSYKWKVGGYEFLGEADDDGNKVKKEVPGKRDHYGLIAQEVKETLDSLNITDFAGWVLDDVNDKTSTQSLNYGEFIAPLIKAVQELSAEVEALKAAK